MPARIHCAPFAGYKGAFGINLPGTYVLALGEWLAALKRRPDNVPNAKYRRVDIYVNYLLSRLLFGGDEKR